MEVAYQTDVGQQRQNNQDYVGFYTNQRGVQFAIVADGMGGHLGATWPLKWLFPISDMNLKKQMILILKRWLSG